ncbi:MAG: polar amino acid transport system substrate-binding protein [Alphaproteobacteria bacterium]|jgi:polar amino acid transport system substrate-binding protein
MMKRFALVYIVFLTGLMTVPALAQNAKLALVGNVVPTLIDKAPYSARANNIVKQALNNYAVTITATTQAWSGSGLRNGTFVGFIDHYSLNAKRANYIYSDPYMVLPLHIASRLPEAKEANRLDKIYRTTLGIENRFANTDELRSERSVRWARTPDFLANIKQLADRRVDNIIADKFMLEAFNNLLKDAKEEPMYLSRDPIYRVELRLAIKTDTPNAQTVIDQFNTSLSTLTTSGELDKLINPASDSTSLLDEALYVDIVRKW